MMRCAGCGREMDAGLLDALQIDEAGDAASEEAYCVMCFPKHQKIETDRWRANDISESAQLRKWRQSKSKFFKQRMAEERRERNAS